MNNEVEAIDPLVDGLVEVLDRIRKTRPDEIEKRKDYFVQLRTLSETVTRMATVKLREFEHNVTKHRPHLVSPHPPKS